MTIKTKNYIPIVCSLSFSRADLLIALAPQSMSLIPVLKRILAKKERKGLPICL